MLKMVDIMNTTEIPEDKPKIFLCEVCAKEPSKYKCPKCLYRTCSLDCSRKHKEISKCDGQRSSSGFGVVRRLADCTAATVAEDEKFLGSIKNSVEGLLNSKPLVDAPAELAKTVDLPAENDAEGSANDKVVNDVCEEKITFEGVEQRHSLTLKQRYLCNNAQRRRIWLTIPKDKEEDGSRHEQFSDTIFWTIDVIFRRETQNEGERKCVPDYCHTVKSIPESISVATLIRQFIKPKKIGPVVNRDDLDQKKLLPFQEAGMDGLTVYMPVPLDNKERFYVVDMKKSILDNTRNRYINEHPVFIVTLDTQMGDYVMLSEQEAQEMREERRLRNLEEHKGQPKFRGNRFRGPQGFRGRSSFRDRVVDRKRHHEGFEDFIKNDNGYGKKVRDEVVDCANGWKEGNSRDSAQESGKYYGNSEREADIRGRSGFRRNGRRFDNRRGGFRNRGRNSIHPLEMSPAQLAAADANRCFDRRNCMNASQDATVLAWTNVVKSRVKQEEKVEASVLLDNSTSTQSTLES